MARFSMICDYIFPIFFHLFFVFNSFLVFLHFDFSSGLLRNQMTGIGIRLGLYGGKMTVSYGWMDWGLVQILYTSFL